MPAYELAINVGATDTASAVIDGVTNKLGGLGKFATGVGGLAVGAFTAVAGAAAGATALAFDTAQDIQSGQRLIQRSLGDSMDAAIDYESVMMGVFGANLGDGLDDIAQTIIEVEQNTERLGGVSQSVLSGMVEDAERFQATFGGETNETIGAATALMENFGLTGEQAFDFITRGQQRGLNSAGDLLDTISEYSPQFNAAGADAGQFFSLLETGIGSGTFLGTDRVADLFGEFRKRILDDSKLTQESLDSLGFNSEQLLGDIASGAVPVAEAFEMVTDALGDTDDLVKQNVAGVGLLGTQFEDLGVDAIRNLDISKTRLEDMAGAADDLAGGFKTLGEVGQGAWRQIGLALAPFGDSILNIINENLPELELAIASVAETVGGIATNFANVVVDFTVGFNDGGFSAGLANAIAQAIGQTEFGQTPAGNQTAGAVGAVTAAAFMEDPPWLSILLTYAWPAAPTAIEILTGDWDWPDVPSGITDLQNWEWPSLGDAISGEIADLLGWTWPSAPDVISDLVGYSWPAVPGVIAGLIAWKWPELRLPPALDALIDFVWPEPEFSGDITVPAKVTIGEEDVEWGDFTHAYDAGAAVGADMMEWGDHTTTYKASANIPAGNVSWGVPNIVIQGTLNLIPRIIGSLPSVFGVGGNASGTESFRGGLSVVGERGPEIVQMPANSRVLNASRTRELRREMGGGNSAPITIVINESSTPRETASAVQSVLQRARSKGIR